MARQRPPERTLADGLLSNASVASPGVPVVRDNFCAVPLSGTPFASFDEVVAVLDDGLLRAFLADGRFSNASVASRRVPGTRDTFPAVSRLGTPVVAFDEVVASSTSRLCAESSSRPGGAESFAIPCGLTTPGAVMEQESRLFR